ncbi:MAG: AAA family ATPase, partial [Chloroflexi bacterium]|nr:AAA family ATPase [Chloroflexota bacterium]
MTYRIQRAVVIGSGTMGGGIAAHLANAGVRTVLLDIVPSTLTPEEEAKGLSLQSKAVRNRIVQTGWDRVVKSSPAALMNKKAGELVQLGNLEDDFAVVSEADWVIEVIVEKLEPKQQLMARIDEIRKAGSIISSNTSGIPIHKIAEGRSDDFKKHFLGTHFFNPPRYLKLLEVIPTPDTDQAIIDYICSFGQERLGKGVVIAKDTPNFIANRIGTFGGAYAMKYIVDNGYTIEEVDALTGTLIGNPKSGTFRLGDLVGIDVMVGVAHNLYNLVPNDESRDALLAPAPVQGLLERGWLGQKSGQGFYKTVKGANGKEFWVLDWETGEHRAPREVDLPIIKQAKKQGNLAARLRFLVNQSQDRGGKLIADTLLPSLAYAARRVPEISDHLYDVDNALRWGFAKEMGPFEMWDAIGLADGVKLMQDRDIQVADWVLTLLEKGHTSFYQTVDGAKQAYSPVTGEYEAVPSSALKIDLDELRSAGKEVARNDSASLLDLGDGVLCFEFHSKMNALDSEITEMGFKALELLKDDRWTGMVVGNQGSDFCIGANIFMLMMAAQNDQFDQLEQMLKTSHDLMQGMRFSPKQDQRLHVRGTFEKVASERRVAAMKRVLAGGALIPSLVDYFDPDTKRMPRKSEGIALGDLGEYDLNDSQEEALRTALLFGPLSLLQGPPGTGKTKFIASFVHLLLSRGLAGNVLLVSQSHEAVNNVMDKVFGLVRGSSLDATMVRVGLQSMVSPGLRGIQEDSLRQRYRETFDAEIKERVRSVGLAMGLPQGYVHTATELHATLGSLLQRIDQLTGTEDETDGEGISTKEHIQRLRQVFLDIACNRFDITATGGEDLEALMSSRLDALAHEHGSPSPAKCARLGQIARLSTEFSQVLRSPRSNYTAFLARCSNIVAGTCVGVGKQALGIMDVPYDWVIVDEAARASPMELVVAIGNPLG